MKFLKDDLKKVNITDGACGESWHVFDDDMINAVNAALAINRPLLLWGEPGIGKSQLAKAVAKELGRAFLHFVADARTESRDLLWTFDAVARLADAQAKSPQRPKEPEEQNESDPLAIQNYLVPGRLWWAMNWASASCYATKSKHQAPKLQDGCHYNHGCVLLIDEIDKADTDVPNGLLEALGSNSFHPQGLDEPVNCVGVKPLVIITTNQERTLPDAFVRRCLSLHLAFPKTQEAQKTFLLERADAQQHFNELDRDKVLAVAADMLIEDRQHAADRNYYPLPGQAEYFDLLRGVQKLSKENGEKAEDYIAKLRTFTFKKHPGFHNK